VELVEDDVFQIPKETLGFAVCKQQRHLFRRRQQDIRRVQLLALALGVRRIAGAVLDRDRQAHLGNGLHEIALNVDGQRLQRRDIECVDACEGRARRDFAAACEVGQRRKKAGERLAGAGWRDE